MPYLSAILTTLITRSLISTSAMLPISGKPGGPGMGIVSMIEISHNAVELQLRIKLYAG
jgi:hypothetical protein